MRFRRVIRLHGYHLCVADVHNQILENAFTALMLGKADLPDLRNWRPKITIVSILGVGGDMAKARDLCPMYKVSKVGFVVGGTLFCLANYDAYLKLSSIRVVRFRDEKF